MRYLLFGGDVWYARGGMGDFIIDSDDLDYLLEVADYLQGIDEIPIYWWHIYDFTERGFVAGSEGQAYSGDWIENQLANLSERGK